MIRQFCWNGARHALRFFVKRRCASFFGALALRGHASRRWLAAALCTLPAAFQAAPASGAYALVKPNRLSSFSTLFGPRLTTTTDWWSSSVIVGKRFHLDPSFDSAEPFRLFQLSTQRFGWLSWASEEPMFLEKARWVPDLFWHVDVNEDPNLEGFSQDFARISGHELPDLNSSLGPSLFAYQAFEAAPTLGIGPMLSAPKPIGVPIITPRSCPSWKFAQKITFAGLAGEGDKFAVIDCEGIVTADAIDRLSVLGRQPGTPLPALPLPLTPQTNPQFPGEWLAGVRLLHPRLMGIVQQIALAFPGHSIAIYSGYRRDARPTSPHLRGRAVDIAVSGVSNEQLYAYCRSLPETGCGYYPNQPFVHVDVREAERGSATWVDISMPGHPSIYAEVWPAPTSALDSPDAE